MNDTKEEIVTRTLDASGMPCPLPLLKAKLALNTIQSGETLKIVATDAGSHRDFQVFARISGHSMLKIHIANGYYTYWLQKK